MRGYSRKKVFPEDRVVAAPWAKTPMVGERAAALCTIGLEDAVRVKIEKILKRRGLLKSKKKTAPDVTCSDNAILEDYTPSLPTDTATVPSVQGNHNFPKMRARLHFLSNASTPSKAYR